MADVDKDEASRRKHAEALTKADRERELARRKAREDEAARQRSVIDHGAVRK